MIMTWDLKVGLYMFSSDGIVEHERIYRHSPPQMGSLVIGLELGWLYPAKPLSLEPAVMTFREALIADMVMFTSILAGSGSIMASYFMIMV